MVLLLALILLLPHLINLEPIRDKIQATVSQKLGGELEFQRIALSFLPRPRVVIHQASLSIPGKISGTLKSLGVHPKILPLLRGKLRIAEVQIERPDFKMSLPEIRVKKTERTKPAAPSPDIKKTLAHLLAPLALNAPDLIVEIKDGGLDFSQQGQPGFSLSNIHARIVFPPSGFRIHLACASNLWEKIAVEGTLDSENLKGKGLINLTNFQPHVLTSYLFPDAPQQLTDSQVNLTCGFKFDGLKALQAELEGSLPRLAFQRGNEKLVVEGKSLKASFQMDPDNTAFSLTELNLDYPQLTMSGKLLINRASPQVSFELEGRDVDISSIRETVLVLAGDDPDVQEILHIVKGGKVPFVALTAQGSRLADLGNLENILIRASILEGKISVPDVDLDLEDVKGEAIISQGILEGENLEARLGNSWARNGKLKLGLEGKDTPFHLDILVQADLTDLPPIMKRLVDDKSFVEEISLIKDLKGSATGKLVLDESTELVKVRLDISEFNLSARYQRIPYPLEMSGGRFSYDEKKISVENLSVNLGKSSFSQLSAGLDLGKALYLDVKSGKADVFLDEIHSWLTSLERSPVKPEDLRALKGTLTLSSVRYKGALAEPGTFDFESTGEIKDVVVNTAVLPSPIKVKKAGFHVIGDAVNQKGTLEYAQISMLDASMNISGTFNDYFKGLNTFDVSLHGDMGPESFRWVSKLIHLPPELTLRAPLSVSEARLVREKGTKISFKANLAVQGGPNVSLDILQSPEELRIKNLVIRDEKSDASLTLNLKNRVLGLTFSGELNEKTLEKIFPVYRFRDGWVRGDFRAHILTDQPMRSTAEGRLEAEHLTLFLWQTQPPLEIDKVSLDAKGNKITLESAIFAWGEERFSLKGNVEVSEEGFNLDMDLAADSLDAQKVQALMAKADKEPAGAGKEPADAQRKDLYDLPIRGLLRVKVNDFKYDRFTVRPLQVNLKFNPHEIEAAVSEASLCGISTPGVVKVTPQGLSLDFQPVAKDQELDSTLNCLKEEEVRVTGNFGLKGEIRAQGKGEELVNSIEGNLELVISDGRVYQHVPMQRLFAYLNVLGIIKGELSEMTKEGFAYKSITAKIDIQNGKIILNEGIIDGLSMGIAVQGHFDLHDKKVDLTVLVSPIKTLDSFIKKIPLIRRITGGTLISVAVKVQGDLTDPKFTPLPPSAVGAGLLGMMKRTVELPFEVIEPLLPKGEEKAVAPKQ